MKTTYLVKCNGKTIDVTGLNQRETQRRLCEAQGPVTTAKANEMWKAWLAKNAAGNKVNPTFVDPQLDAALRRARSED